MADDRAVFTNTSDTYCQYCHNMRGSVRNREKAVPLTVYRNGCISQRIILEFKSINAIEFFRGKKKKYLCIHL